MRLISEAGRQRDKMPSNLSIRNRFLDVIFNRLKPQEVEFQFEYCFWLGFFFVGCVSEYCESFSYDAHSVGCYATHGRNASNPIIRM